MDKEPEKSDLPLQVESVWEYPRPPRLEPVPQRIRIVHQQDVLAETVAALRILETSHPPVYYLPPACFGAGLLRRSQTGGSFCEFKGVATYWDLVLSASEVVEAAGWTYESPTRAYAALSGHVALYGSRLGEHGIECWVGSEQVRPQEGDFYGGWITANLRGPFKGAPGTRGW
jgi:uncharacterized protein (DUF427 family)